MKKFIPEAENIINGISASLGIAIGKVYILSTSQPAIERRQISVDEIPDEIQRFRLAVHETKDEIARDKKIAHKHIGEDGAQIFEVHNLILVDPEFIKEVEKKINDDKTNAEYVFHELLLCYIERLTKNGGILEHGESDLQDVKQRVLHNLFGTRRNVLSQLTGSAVIISNDLMPSAVLLHNRHKILGFATDFGGKTSHAAIIVRSYGLPSVVGLQKITQLCHSGDRIIVDGFDGLVLINPNEVTIEHYQQKQNRWMRNMDRLEQLHDLPTRTLDGRDIELAANIEFTDEVKLVKLHGAQGVGLLRTEFFYLDRKEPPTEEEQFLEYHRIATELAPQSVIIRTMDLGGDKIPQCLTIPRESNPFLGWRAIRICLEMPDFFKDQIKAILRANTEGNVKMLIPMISGIKELEDTLALIEESKEELIQAGKEFGSNTEVGVMIEVPSAAVLADVIAERVDFLSIGTNDLVQYTLAVDRGNERIAHLWSNLHPAILRLIKSIISAGHSKGVWVGVCGEMAADRLATLLLVGMEIDELSVSPIDVPEIKKNHTKCPLS